MQDSAATVSILPDGSDDNLKSGRSEGRLTQRAFLNTVASLIDYAAWMIVGLVTNPILVSVLGSSRYGIWKILGQSVGYLGYADGGGPQALKWMVAKDREVVSTDRLRRYVGAAAGTYLLFAPVLLLTGAVIVWLSPILTKASYSDWPLIRLACGLLVISFFVGMLTGIPESVLRGMNLGYKRMGVQALLGFCGGALLVTAAWTGFNLPAMAIAQTLMALVSGVVYWRICISAVPWFGLVRVPLKESLKFVRISGNYLAWTLVDNVLRGSDLIILGYLASPAVVTVYVLSRFAAETSGKVIRTVVFGILPGLGGIIGSAQYKKAADVRHQIMAVTHLLVVSLGATILLCNRAFVSLWIGSEQYGGTLVNILTVLLFIQMSFAQNDSAIMVLALKPMSLVRWGIAASAISIGLGLWLIPKYGIVGLCLALLIGKGILSVVYPVLVSRFLGIRAIDKRRAMLRMAVVGCLLLAVGAVLGVRTIAYSYFSLAVFAATSFSGFFTIMLLAGFDKRQRQVLMGYVRRIG